MKTPITYAALAAFATLALSSGLSQAQTTSFSIRAQDNSGSSITSGIGTITRTTQIIDGTVSGFVLTYSLSGLTLDGDGSANDSMTISFIATSGGGNFETNNTSGGNWLAEQGGGSNNFIDTATEEVKFTYSSTNSSVTLSGGGGAVEMLTFDGFTGGNIGKSGSVVASDQFLISGETITGLGSNDFTLTDQSKDYISFKYGNASMRAIAWDFGVTVTLAEVPAIVNFTADDRSVDSGQVVTLSWNATNGTTFSIDQGVGDVTALTTNGSGSTQVTLNAATTYTLTVTNAQGNAVASVPIHLRPSKPNVLVILIDDWGTEDCSVNFNLDASNNPIPQIDPTTVGLPAFSQTNSHYHTPTLETLAAQGTIFTRAYVSPVCSPTRVTFMTGQNTARHRTINFIGGGGARFNIKSQPNRELTAANRTIAEVMRDGGYRTIIVGKGHIGAENLDINNYKSPAAAPADDFYGFQINVAATGKGQHRSCYSNASPAFNIKGSSVSEDEFVAEYQNKTYNDIDPVKYGGETWKDEPLYVTEALTIEIMERIEDSVDLGKPFFAYFSHYATHQPHQLDPRFQNNPKYTGLSGKVLNLATMVEGVDQSTADVINKLEELGVAEDTIIVFFGDNGSEADPGAGGNPTTLGMSNPLRGQKGHRHEGGSRVPFIISWAKPDAANSHQQAFPILAGQEEHDIIAGQDLYPTICAAAGLPLPTTDDNSAPLVIDGHNLAGYLVGTAGNHRPQKLLIHFPTPHAHDFYSILHKNEWKLIYNYNCTVANLNVEAPLGTYELYNLDADPYESDNRATASSSNYDPDRVMSMARELVAEIALRNGEYPYLLGSDTAMAAINLPSSTNDPHPVILPAIAGVDTDGDNLDDNVEDPNRNGIMDSGETNSENEDTDGDSAIDGDEFKLGLDPLDQNSRFYLNPTPLGGGDLQITWPSAPGVTFTIRSSTDLSDWTTIVAAGVNASAGTTTNYNVGNPSGTRTFYRVELED